MEKKFKCPCGYEDDNEANFNYHQQWCDRKKPRGIRFSGNVYRLEPDQPPSVETQTPLEELEEKRSFRLNKADKVILGIILVSFILYLPTLLW